MTIEENRPCNQCEAEPGEQHREWDDIARCRISGIQGIQCDKRHNHQPDTWDGEYPGTKACREFGWYTSPDSPWGVTEDLNRLYGAQQAVWNWRKQKWVLRT